ncbi:BLUF domain-containing protein [Zunongwangia sp. F363]|uniref:BLUF domain-containing protein n=1 Tax=Autumnicola tepida TaxID=3075595 RepID=A0ABU3C658_9FLAO|nr:BLUF domain-containing protein [Zunongwangia sp. F363]MDT0641652.1 BLUF domain-containing protein [Zunongwangia sp. F363]
MFFNINTFKMRHAISYVSTARRELSSQEVEEILKISEINNNNNNITGLLLFSEGNFFQVLEGEEHSISDLYEKIKQDKSHHSIIKIFEKPINKESFEEYSCKFLSSEVGYEGKAIDRYLENIKSLDNSTQKAIKNLLGSFIAKN